jgi:MFS transporter, ACS family, allantoate permease
MSCEFMLQYCSLPCVLIQDSAPICNGFIAWTISYYNGPFPPWKIIFLTLGAFTIIWSFVVFFFLPNNPLEAKWLSSRQKMILIQRKASDNTGMENKAFKWSHIREAALDVKMWLIWFAIVALQVPNGGLSTFNTLIIQGLGFSELATSLLAMPPGAMSTLSGIALSFLAATTRRYRTVMISAAVLLPLLGAVLCYALPRSNLAGQLVGLYILYTYWAPYVTLVSVYQANIAGHTKKTWSYGWYFVAWTLGNIIGPQTFRAEQAPAYIGGITAMMVCYVAAMALILTYMAVCRIENRKRDREAGGTAGFHAQSSNPGDDLVTQAPGGQNDWLDLTDKENRRFRYTT